MNVQKEHCRFFQNSECEYFPCHKGVSADKFNCLFCYCPLYALGKGCGGDYWYNEQGTKVCTDCVFAHISDNYPAIIARLGEIRQLIHRNDELTDWKGVARKDEHV